MSTESTEDRNPEADRVWVLIETRGINLVKSLQGRIARSDFEAILGNTFAARFVRITDTHWQREQWDPESKTKTYQILRPGRDFPWTHHTGTFYAPVADIVLMAILTGPAVGYEDDGTPPLPARNERPGEGVGG